MPEHFDGACALPRRERGVAFLTFCLLGMILCSLQGWAAEPNVDFNGDDRGDLFLRNPYSGEVMVWLTDGTQILSKQSVGVRTPDSGWLPVGLGDANGDGRTDLFWRNAFSGELQVWLLNGGTAQLASYGVVDPSSGWTVIGLVDVNGDGRSDILWRNGLTGNVSVWLLNGGTVLSAASYGVVPPNSGWTPLGFKDVNGDGRADILWRHAQSGQLYIWLLNGGSILQAGSYGTVAAATGWGPIGLADVNNDGRSDLIWRNYYSGQVAAWLLNGFSVTSVSYGTLPLSTGWSPISVSDFNGDGKSDILWYNSKTGEYASWFLNGRTLLGTATYGAIAQTSGWSPLFIDDLNGDGRSDILWYNLFDYSLRAWLMGSGGVASSPSLGPLPTPSAWVVGG